MSIEQLFYACAIGGILLSVCTIALGMVWLFGGDKVREQIKEEW